MKRWVLFIYIFLITFSPCCFLLLIEGDIGTKANPSFIGENGVIGGIGFNRTDPVPDIERALESAFDRIPFAQCLVETHNLFVSEQEMISIEGFNATEITIYGVKDNLLQNKLPGSFFKIQENNVNLINPNYLLISESFASNYSLHVGQELALTFHLMDYESIGNYSLIRNETVNVILEGIVDDPVATPGSCVFNYDFITDIYDGNGSAPVVLSHPDSPFKYNTRRYLILESITANFVTMSTISDFIRELSTVRFDSGYDQSYQEDLRIFINPDGIASLLSNEWFWIIVFMTLINLFIVIVFISKHQLKLASESLNEDLFLFKVKGYKISDVILHGAKLVLSPLCFGSLLAFFSSIAVTASIPGFVQMAFFLHPTSYLLSGIAALAILIFSLISFFVNIQHSFKEIHTITDLRQKRLPGVDKVVWSSIDTIMLVISLFGIFLFLLSFNAPQIWAFEPILSSFSQILKGILVIFPFMFIFSFTKVFYVLVHWMVIKKDIFARLKRKAHPMSIFTKQNRVVYSKYFFTFMVLVGMQLGLGLQYSALGATERQSLVERSYLISGADLKMVCPNSSIDALTIALENHSFAYASTCVGSGAELTIWGSPRQVVILGVSNNMFSTLVSPENYFELSGDKKITDLHLAYNEVLVSSNTNHLIGEDIKLSTSWENITYNVYTVVGIYHAIPGYTYYSNYIINYNQLVQNASINQYIYVKFNSGQSISGMDSVLLDAGLQSSVTIDKVQTDVYQAMVNDSYLPILDVANIFTILIFTTGIILNSIMFVHRRRTELGQYVNQGFDFKDIEIMMVQERKFDVVFSGISGLIFGILSPLIFISLMNVTLIYGTFSSSNAEFVTQFSVPPMIFILMPSVIFIVSEVLSLILFLILSRKFMESYRIKREII